MTNIKHFTFNFLREHCMVVWKDGSTDAVIIDPGAFDQGEMDSLTGFLDSRGLNPAAILLTHSHYDHIFGAGRLQRRYGMKIYMHPAEQEVMRRYATLAPEIQVDTLDLGFSTRSACRVNNLHTCGLTLEGLGCIGDGTVLESVALD